MRAASVADEIKQIWEKANIPSIQKQNIIIKIKKLHSEWVHLTKSKNSRYQSDIKKRHDFIDQFNLIFNIGYVKRTSYQQLKKSIKNEMMEIENFSASESEMSDSSDDFYYKKPESEMCTTNSQVNLNSSEVCSALDRTVTSCGSGSLVIQSTLYALLYDVNEIASSKTTT